MRFLASCVTLGSYKGNAGEVGQGTCAAPWIVKHVVASFKPEDLITRGASCHV